MSSFPQNPHLKAKVLCGGVCACNVNSWVGTERGVSLASQLNQGAPGSLRATVSEAKSWRDDSMRAPDAKLSGCVQFLGSIREKVIDR